MMKCIDLKYFRDKYLRMSYFSSFSRWMYIAIASLIVIRGFYNGYEKMKRGDVLSREVRLVFNKMRYPSITFCYKYKHGSKKVSDIYLPKHYEKAKETGEESIIIIYFNHKL